MDTKRIAILFSGNGSNLEALIKFLHQKYFIPRKNSNDQLQNDEGGFLIGGISHSFERIEEKSARFVEPTHTHLQSPNISEPFKVEVVLALSNKRDAFGLTRAKNLGVATKVIESASKSREDFDAEVVATLQSLQLDLCILAGFMRILTPIFTQKIRALNIHPSLLPLFKGAHGITESYTSSMCLGGVSVHYVSEELDSGEIIAQGVIPKIANESLESYEARIHRLEHRLYPLAVLEALNKESK